METLDRFDSDNPEETPDPFDSVRSGFAETIRQLYNLVEDQFQALADAKSLRGGNHSAQISTLINDGLKLCEDQSLRLDDLAAQLRCLPLDSAEILSQLDEVEKQVKGLNSTIHRIVVSTAGETSPAPSKPPKKTSRKKKPTGGNSADSSETA
jgi:hypothetical protein